MRITHCIFPIVFTSLIFTGEHYGETITDVMTPRAFRQQSITAPISIPSTSSLQKDYLIAHGEWCKRNFIEPFKKYALKGDAWNADARHFVEEALPFWELGEGDIPPSLTILGKNILDAGCQDPLVGFLWANLRYREMDNWREALVAYRKALKWTDTTPYPKALARMIAMDMRDTERRGGRNVDELDQKIIALTVAALADGSYTMEEEQIFVRHILRGYGRKFIGQYIDDLYIAFENAELSEWAKHTLFGAAEIRLGWTARGGSKADNVDEDDLEDFDDFLTGARHLLAQAWEHSPHRPEPAVDMIKIVMAGRGDPDDTLRMWFDRAVAAQCDYRPAYSAVLWALRPRWGGSHKLMLDFARSCLDTERFDTSIPTVYLKALNDIYSETGDWRKLYRQPEVASDVVRLSRALIVEPTRQHERSMRECMLAVNAWMAGDYDTAIRQWKVIDEILHPIAIRKLERYHIDEAWFRGEMAILAGPAREDFIKTEHHFAHFETTEAIRLYERVQRNLNEYGPADHIVNVRLESLLIEEDLESGNWVALPATRDLWSTVRGEWTVGEKDALVNHGTDNNALIVSTVRVGPNFEVRGSFSVDAKRDCCKSLGVAVGYRTSRVQDWKMCYVWQSGTSPTRAAIATRFGTSKKRTPVNFHPENTFLIRVNHRGIYYYLNDEMVQRGHMKTLGPHQGADFQFGLGAREFCRHNTTTIRNIEVRRLLPKPEPSI